MRANADASPFILSLVRKVERQSGHTVKSCHFDGGGEFKESMSSFEDNSVIFFTTARYRLSFYVLAERKNDKILSLARTVPGQDKLPVKYWPEIALPYAVTVCDEPTVKEAFKSKEASYWVGAIIEEYDTLEEAFRTCVDDYDIPSNAEEILTRILLRLNRDDYVKHTTFKGRLVVQAIC